MKRLLFILVLVLFVFSCKKETSNEPCIDCSTEWWLSDKQHPGTEYGSDGYWHLKYSGLSYFQIEGKLSQLKPEFVVNGVPLIETTFDSDLWFVADTLAFKINLFSPFGDYSDRSFRYPIAKGSRTIWVTDYDRPINSTGYTYQDLNFVNSKYTYFPKCELFVNKDCIGDTMTIFMNTKWGEYPDIIEKKDQLKVIIE